MSNGYAADEPRHVEMAAIDEDVRQCAIDSARNTLIFTAALLDGNVGQPRYLPDADCWLFETPERRARLDRAIRVLRHFGLLVEHGDGVVSVKEQA